MNQFLIQKRLQILQDLGRREMIRLFIIHDLELNKLKFKRPWINNFKHIQYSALFSGLGFYGIITYQTNAMYLYWRFAIGVSQGLFLFCLIYSSKPAFNYLLTLIKFYKNEKSIKKLKDAVQNL